MATKPIKLARLTCHIFIILCHRKAPNRTECVNPWGPGTESLGPALARKVSLGASHSNESEPQTKGKLAISY